MPYNPSTGVYSLPAIYIAIPGTTIIAAQHNDPLVDLQTANNYPRPVIAGGTGATNPAGARANLEVSAANETVTFAAPTVDTNVPRFAGVSGEVEGSALSIDDNGNATLVSTDAGALAGPIEDLYRDSASPAANDIIGSRQWTGEDSAGNKEVYAEDRVQILDPTSGSEDAKIVRRTVVAGTLADRMHVGAGMWMEGANDPGGGKINATEVQRSGTPLGLNLQTAQPTTSGTAFDFADIPSWVTQIEVLFNGVSLSGTDNILVQLGDAGGIESTGYSSASSTTDGGSTGSAASTAGYIISVNTAARAVSGIMTIAKISGNTWVASVAVQLSAGGTTGFGGGTKTLSDPLTQLRVTRDGTNTFDAGLLNINYE